MDPLVSCSKDLMQGVGEVLGGSRKNRLCSCLLSPGNALQGLILKAEQNKKQPWIGLSYS